jgi:trimethylamine--corrinoid protein Co-methyltransferase
MLEFESCQSLEKLVIDDEICGLAKRLIAGLAPRGERLAEDLFGDLSQGDHFLTSPTTLAWLRPEITSPSRVIDRQRREEWQKGGRKDALQNARERVQELLAAHSPKPLPDDVCRHLTDLMARDAKRHGMERLP